MEQSTTHDENATILYRLYDADEGLLYVGITNRGPRRWREHQAHKPWWSDVAAVRVEHFPTYAEAVEAEISAIRDECPAHNVAHSSNATDEQAEQIAELHTKAQKSREVADSDAAALHAAVSEQLESGGLSAIQMAGVLGVSRGRIYQLARKAGEAV